MFLLLGIIKYQCFPTTNPLSLFCVFPDGEDNRVFVHLNFDRGFTSFTVKKPERSSQGGGTVSNPPFGIITLSTVVLCQGLWC